MALWRLPVRAARQRGERIVAEAEEKEEAFRAHQSRVAIATARAERAAVILMTRSDDLARSVAQPR